MTGKAKRSDALGIAIRMEEEGIRFYSKAAGQAGHTLAGKMFASLVKDEERHRAIFQEMAAQEGVRPSRADELDESNPAKRVQSVFKGAAAKVRKPLRSADEVIRAIDIALGMEEKSYFFYAEAARTMADPQEKQILLKIAEEENEHFRILNDTRLYLTYPQMWNIIQEKPVIDGAF
jgi:rubrerythrin